MHIGHLGKKERDLPFNVGRGCLFNKWCWGNKNKKRYLHAIELECGTLPHSIYEKLLKINQYPKYQS